MKLIVLPFLFLSLSSLLIAQERSYYFSRFAGVPGISGGLDGNAAAPSYFLPRGLGFDGAGNLYIADSGNHLIRRVSPSGTSASIAGVSGSVGSGDGLGMAAKFSSPSALVVDASGDVFIADTGNHVIRKLTRDGMVSTYAGFAGTFGAADGAGSASRFNQPGGIALDFQGNLIVVDTWNHTLRRIDREGVVSTIAGSPGNPGHSDGPSIVAAFRAPQGIAIGSTGIIYISDTQNHVIRRVALDGVVSTLAGAPGVGGNSDGVGSESRFSRPTGLAFGPDGNLYIADTGNRLIRRLTLDGVVTTISGAPSAGRAMDGFGPAAVFQSPEGIVSSPHGGLLVSDSTNGTIRRVSLTGEVVTFSGTPLASGSMDGTGVAASFESPYGIAVDSAQDVYVADTLNHTVRKVSRAGVVSTVAGSLQRGGFSDGKGVSARFNYPVGVGLHTDGSLYVADAGNHAIRRISTDGEVTTVAGAPTRIGSLDGVAAGASFFTPSGLALAADGSVFVADTGNHVVRVITPDGMVKTIAGAAGRPGFIDGIGEGARLQSPFGIAVDAAGLVYIADTANHSIRRLSRDGQLVTISGSPSLAGSLDGPNVVARFRFPYSLCVDQSGRVFVADYGNSTIRRIADGYVLTIGGTAGRYGASDGKGTSALFYDPAGIAVDSDGAILIADSSNNAVRRGILEGAPVFRSHPASQSVPAGSVVRFAASVSAQPAAGLQWLKDGSAITGATSESLTLVNVQSSSSGSYSLRASNQYGTSSSLQAALSVSVAVPSILVQPASQLAAERSEVNLTVSAGGTEPFTFQWRRNGVDIPGATSASLRLSFVQSVDSGNYDVTVAGPGGSITSKPAVITVVYYLPPTITTQPSSLTVVAGAAASFSVSSIGSGVTSYLWRRNGSPIPGGTNSVLNLKNVGSSDAGSIDVTVSNLGGSVISRPAILTILSAPQIVSQPRSQTGSAGESLSLSVDARGSGNLAYQWKKNGASIPGATSPVFTIQRLVSTDAGDFSVTVSNEIGTVVSSVANVVVTMSGLRASHFTEVSGYAPGGVVTVVCTMVYSGKPAALGWQVLLPAGWKFVRDGGTVGSVRPRVGDSDLLEWAWTEAPSSPVTFSYTVAVPAGQTGEKSIAAVMVFRELSGSVSLLATPDPLPLPSLSVHSADTNHDFKIGLLELTRVIELYNTRSGSLRTGRYKIQIGTEDGFAPDP